MEDCFNDLLLGQGEGVGWRCSAPRKKASLTKSTPIGEKSDADPDIHEIASATLWGGNLSVLVSLLGTPYFPSVKGGILFVEDVAEHPYRIERMLTQLLHAGVLARQKAIIFGQFTNYTLTSHDRGFNLERVRQWLKSQVSVPIFDNLPFGHVATKVLLPVGARVALSSQGRDVMMAWGHL